MNQRDLKLQSAIVPAASIQQGTKAISVRKPDTGAYSGLLEGVD